MDIVAASSAFEPSRTEARGAARVAGFWPALLLAAASTSLTIGIIWDISWHISIGRDTFWTPAHMAIYLGGAMSGLVGGWLALQHTFFAGPAERAASVGLFGARAPLGAWIAIWGSIAMLTSAPFDDWWHNAYGLDVKIVSPPHTVLGLGMFGISAGALILVLSRQNRGEERAGTGLFIYTGGIFIVLGSVFIMEFTTPNLQHAARFYEVCALIFPIRLVALGRAGRVSWPATRMAAVYIGMSCLMIWILPLFPAQPKLAPIYNPVTRMVPPAFPILVIVPALLIDLVLVRAGDAKGWARRAAVGVALGAVFVAALLPAQWFFSEFLLNPHSDNWFFAGNRYWGYQNGKGEWRHLFWRLDPSRPDADLITLRSLGVAWALAAATSWLGLAWGDWMRKVRR
jgi:hypothetical protein